MILLRFMHEFYTEYDKYSYVIGFYTIFHDFILNRILHWIIFYPNFALYRLCYILHYIITWVLDVEFHLNAKEFGDTLSQEIKKKVKTKKMLWYSLVATSTRVSKTSTWLWKIQKLFRTIWRTCMITFYDHKKMLSYPITRYDWVHWDYKTFR